jgi:hypothetical protein
MSTKCVMSTLCAVASRLIELRGHKINQVHIYKPDCY